MQQNTEAAVKFSSDNTRLVADLGQFTTHDILQTPDLAGKGPDPCNCKKLPKECDHIFTNADPVIVFRCFFIVKSVGKMGRSGTGVENKVSLEDKGYFSISLEK